MAQAANQVQVFRTRVSSTVDALRGIDALLGVIEDAGTTDAERQTFFQSVFGASTDNPDISYSEFALGIVALRAMRTAWQSNRVAIFKLLK